jgi:hypothetical protein
VFRLVLYSGIEALSKCHCNSVLTESVMGLVIKGACSYNGQLGGQLDRHLSRVVLGTRGLDGSHHELEISVMDLMMKVGVFTGC